MEPAQKMTREPSSQKLIGNLLQSTAEGRGFRSLTMKSQDTNSSSAAIRKGYGPRTIFYDESKAKTLPFDQNIGILSCCSPSS